MKIKLLLWNTFVLKTKNYKKNKIHKNCYYWSVKKNRTCKEEENREVHELTVHVNANVLPL